MFENWRIMLAKKKQHMKYILKKPTTFPFELKIQTREVKDDN